MKRARLSDTTTGAVSMLMEALQGPPDPPDGVELHSEDMRHWDAIIGTRPRSEWTPHDLEVAAMTARAMAEVVRLESLLKKTGNFTKDRFGEPKLNPVVAALDTHTRRLLSLKRSLGLATDSENTVKRTEAFKGARALAKQLANEPLLAQ